jgi:DNA-binding beta-propeller fold protein YncE
LLAALALPARGLAAAGQRYALLVGVREYRHAKFPNLKYTENDVEELARLLRQPAAGFARTVVLTSTRGKKRPAEQPTAANIRAQLRSILTRATKHDTVLVALSGHGVQLRVADPLGGKKERDEAFFCPADARLTSSTNARELGKTLISLKELFGQLDDSGAGMKLLLVDACRNDPKEARSLDPDAVPRPARGIGALFSCSSGQRAFETPRLGRGHGVFFHFVLEGLKGAAKNEDWQVTWDDLTAYVKRRVPRAVPRLIGGGARQEPHLVANLTGEPAILVRLPRRPPTGVAGRWLPERAFGPGASLKVAPKNGGYWINRVALTPDGKYCVAAGGGLILFDLSSGKEVRRILEVRGARPGLALSRDGKSCLTGHAHSTVAHLVEVPSFKIARTFLVGARVTAVALSADGRRAAVAAVDGHVRQWDVKTGRELRKLFFGAGEKVRSLSFSPDGKRLLAGLYARGGSARVEVVFADSGARPRVYRGHKADVTAVAFLPGGSAAVSASLDGTVQRWDTGTGRLLGKIEHKGGVYDVAVSPDGKQVLSAGFRDRNARLWDVQTGRAVSVLGGHLAGVLGVAFAPNGQRAASCDSVYCVRLWKRLR